MSGGEPPDGRGADGRRRGGDLLSLAIRHPGRGAGRVTAVARGASAMRPPRSRPLGADGEEPRLPRVVQAAVATSSSPSIVHRRERCWYVSARRAPGVSTSNSVRGPVIAGYAERSSRTATRRVTGMRSSPHVISRGAPSNQSVRTWTLTGATRTIAMAVLLRRVVVVTRGHFRMSNACSFLARGWTEQVFDVKPCARSIRRACDTCLSRLPGILGRQGLDPVVVVGRS